MRNFNPNEFEKKWQKKWEEDKIYYSDKLTNKPTCFVMDMFPYPSGSSMHVGHPRGYVATDVYSRFKRMNGFNILHPMGWDAFGLPAEETAIQNKEYPAFTVKRNIEKFKSQLMMVGLGYDWSREISTTDPKYYLHTQQIFLEFFRRGLARNDTVAVNWCPGLGTVLANEDIVNGKSELGDHPVFQKPMRQWILAITQYADRLIDDLELLPNWPEKVKNAQRNWIGRSNGHEFEISTNVGINVTIFTTQIETIPGSTFVVIAPENDLVKKIIIHSKNRDKIEEYVKTSSQKTNLDRQILNMKSGIIIEGVTAVNPFTMNQIPIIVADYVLSSQGTGAIMAVPAHNDKDKIIADILDLPSVDVISNGIMQNSSFLDDETVENARVEISRIVKAKKQKRYKIRDWVFSRQRFWGEPFPIVWIQGKDTYDLISMGDIKEWLPKEPVFYNEDGIDYFAVPVIPKFLESMRLPEVDSYEPTGTIEGPLAGISQWVNAFMNPLTGEVSNIQMNGNWISVRRETNTMPQWAGSSWYWLRYMDPNNERIPFSKESSQYWGPVNIYAGADHAVAHLIYARFWHKVMQDAGMIDFPEPFERLEFLGYILASDGTKISKRKRNSRNPEEIIEEVGADSLRLYEMFIGPFEKAIPWNDNNLLGSRRFLERVWRFAQKVIEDDVAISSNTALYAIHQSIKKVGEDIETFHFNTAVSSLMICLNEIQDSQVSVSDMLLYVSLLAPFAPHMTEEIWSICGNGSSVHISAWPKFIDDLTQKNEIVLPIQINGKHVSEIKVLKEIDEIKLKANVLNDSKVQKILIGKQLKRFIYVPGRIVNLVV